MTFKMRLSRKITSLSSGRQRLYRQLYYGWKCECGATSRGYWSIISDARYRAETHAWRKGLDHPKPEITNVWIDRPKSWL